MRCWILATVSEPAPGGSNDDFLLVGSRWALVLDGVSRYPVDDIGCVHGVGWYVAKLGAYLGQHLEAAKPDAPLHHLLADAIREVATDHISECDLTNPFTPAATVALWRIENDQLEWLVLGDATVAWQLSDGTASAVTDDRLEHLPDAPIIMADVRRYDLQYVIGVRNKPGGFWVAAADPEAADEALTGSLPLDQIKRLGLYSDGVTRLVERYAYTWIGLFDMAADNGPRGLVDAVRTAEASDPDPSRWRGKVHDDATAVVARIA